MPHSMGASMGRLTIEQRSAWADHLQAQRDSGLTQQVYCKQQALKPHQFWYWKRKLESRGVKKSLRTGKPGQAGFVPVSIATQAPLQYLSITLANGMTVEGIAVHNRLLEQQLIGALK